MICAYRLYTWLRWKLARGATNAFADHCPPQRHSRPTSQASISTNDCRLANFT
jgi:hypothetical protein